METISPARPDRPRASRLLRLLRQQSLALPFRLSFIKKNHSPEDVSRAVQDVCCLKKDDRCWSQACLETWRDSILNASRSGTPQIHVCKGCFLGFVVPVPADGVLDGYVLGGGLQEATARQRQLTNGTLQDKPLARISASSTTTATFDETAAVVQSLSRKLPRLLDRHFASSGLERVTKNLEAARLLSREISGCSSFEEAAGMTAETLAVLFDASRVLIQMTWPGRVGRTRAALGFVPGQLEMIDAAVPEILTEMNDASGGLPEDLVTKLLPGTMQGSVCYIPLQSHRQPLGFVLLFDVELATSDHALCDLVLERLATHLQQLKTEHDHSRERDLSRQLVNMISELGTAKTQTALYRKLMEMTADLCDAESGSLMLLDEASATLNVVAARGMSAPVAQSVALPVGQGIAGRVLQKGEVLLVNDIEKDVRVASRNRPRFKTKSFLCLPLKKEDRFIGVLNLADKRDGSSFKEGDLAQVQALIQHAAQMLERTAVVEKVEHLEQLSITDPLTGLYNRRLLESRLEEEISRSQRQKQTFSIILADLDHFKIYNDILGHLAGDKALKKVASLMRGTAREMDIVTRYGGEEFCLVLPGAAKQESLFGAERLRRAIEAASFPGESYLPQGRLTISIGISSYPEDGDTPEKLLHAADLALYRAKHNGRNRLVLYQGDLSHTLSPSQAS